MAAKKTKKKNSLVANINKRKKAGKSRPKSRSKISKKSYTEMESGWPHSKKTKAKKAKKKSAPKKTAKKTTKRTAKKKIKKTTKKRA